MSATRRRSSPLWRPFPLSLFSVEMAKCESPRPGLLPTQQARAQRAACEQRHLAAMIPKASSPSSVILNSVSGSARLRLIRLCRRSRPPGWSSLGPASCGIGSAPAAKLPRSRDGSPRCLGNRDERRGRQHAARGACLLRRWSHQFPGCCPCCGTITKPVDGSDLAVLQSPYIAYRGQISRSCWKSAGDDQLTTVMDDRR
jgi:hypothetical protein